MFLANLLPGAIHANLRQSLQLISSLVAAVLDLLAAQKDNKKNSIANDKYVAIKNNYWMKHFLNKHFNPFVPSVLNWVRLTKISILI